MGGDERQLETPPVISQPGWQMRLADMLQAGNVPLPGIVWHLSVPAPFMTRSAIADQRIATASRSRR